jgi:hypothetical protein
MVVVKEEQTEWWTGCKGRLDCYLARLGLDIQPGFSRVSTIVETTYTGTKLLCV